MTSLFDISSNSIHDFAPYDDEYSSLSELFSNDEKENIISIFPFDVLKEDERKENLKRKPRFRTQKVSEEIKNKRKDKEDDIRKKIKSNFLRILLITINELLKLAGSAFTFKSFPQNFIADITKQTNYEVMKLTYEELFDYTHEKVVEENKYELKPYQKQSNRVAKKKFEKNMKTLEYLNKNKEISEKSGWERIRKMKYIDLLKAFFNSKKFANSVNELRQKEDKNYINNYLFFASTYIDYFQNYKPSTKKRIKRRQLIATVTPITSLPSIFEERDDNSIQDILSFPSYDSSFIHELTNQESLFSDELNEVFH